MGQELLQSLTTIGYLTKKAHESSLLPAFRTVTRQNKTFRRITSEQHLSEVKDETRQATSLYEHIICILFLETRISSILIRVSKIGTGKLVRIPTSMLLGRLFLQTKAVTNE
jgi:hypothetical protein